MPHSSCDLAVRRCMQNGPRASFDPMKSAPARTPARPPNPRIPYEGAGWFRMIEKCSGWRSALFASWLVLTGLISSHEASAEGPRFFLPEIAVDRLAKHLADESLAADMFGEPCRLYMSDREGIVGTVIANESYTDLQDAFSQEFHRRQPARDCKILILNTPGRPDIDDMIDKQKSEGRSGSFLVLRMFQIVDGIRLIADGYKEDGSSAMRTSGIDVALEPMAEAASAGAIAPPIPSSDQQSDEKPRADPGKESFIELLRKREGTELAD